MVFMHQPFDFFDFQRFLYDKFYLNSDFFEETCLKKYFNTILKWFLVAAIEQITIFMPFSNTELIMYSSFKILVNDETIKTHLNVV